MTCVKRHTAWGVGRDWKAVGGKIRTGGPERIHEQSAQNCIASNGIGEFQRLNSRISASEIPHYQL